MFYSGKQLTSTSYGIMCYDCQLPTLYVKEGNDPLLSLGGCKEEEAMEWARKGAHTCHMLATFGAHPNRWSVSTSPNAHYPTCFSTEHGNTMTSLLLNIFFLRE